MDWNSGYEKMRPYVVKVETPRLSGTGFLFTYTRLPENWCGIATAAHVLAAAGRWGEPIAITHVDSGKSVVVRDDNRAVLMDEKRSRDAAALLMPVGEFPFPENLPRFTDPFKYLGVGTEIGWIGFPALSSGDLCFFGGKVSSWKQDVEVYLVDGVAIHGVSGGPAFILDGNEPVVAGVVSAYRPNRATGEALPGLAVVQHVQRLHEVVQTLRSLEEAKAKEAAEIESAASNPESRGASQLQEGKKAEN